MTLFFAAEYFRLTKAHVLQTRMRTGAAPRSGDYALAVSARRSAQRPKKSFAFFMNRRGTSSADGSYRTNQSSVFEHFRQNAFCSGNCMPATTSMGTAAGTTISDQAELADRNSTHASNRLIHRLHVGHRTQLGASRMSGVPTSSFQNPATMHKASVAPDQAPVAEKWRHV
ncbi:hypothetical protein ACFFYR_38515 [Paraburkholderia dipogonis]|uniref:hypothetical protein n=1 Tax=Paraburkholderia dipogonis TaxID=1211383 RepID=UPI0035E7D143